MTLTRAAKPETLGGMNRVSGKSVEGEVFEGIMVWPRCMPQHRRGHEPGPKQNLRRTAEPCLLARPQCCLGKNWSISRPGSYESNGLIFMVNIFDLLVGSQTAWCPIVKNSDSRYR